MIVRTHRITFSAERVPLPKTIEIGFEGDNMVERLMFKLPDIAVVQRASLMMGGMYANMATLIESEEENRYYIDLTARLIGENGRTECYVIIDGENGEVWQSETLKLIVGDVPDTEGEIEQRFPTAVEQMRQEMAAHEIAMNEAAAQAQSAAECAQSAVNRMPIIGDNGNWWLWDAERGEYADSGMPSRGSGGGGSVESVNGRKGTVVLTHEEVGADPVGTAAAAVSGHNTNKSAHGDLRSELQALADRNNAVLDSNDETLDELSEIVAYIKSNKSLIDAVTTSKVNVSDIVNNLTTHAANKPLSAAQGAALKGLIDAITVPTKVSALTNDAGYLTEHQDISGKLDADKLPEAVNSALAQAKVSGEFDGADGANGVSATHSWNGTVLTVTSASGTSSADLKGADGKTPVKGTDYYTTADKAEMTAAVKAALPSETWTFTLSDGSTVTKKVYAE